MVGTRNIKTFSLKELEKIVCELWNRGDIPITKYIGSGLYNVDGMYIVNEKALEEINKEILKQIKATAK